MVVSLNQINTEDAWEYLIGIYSLSKLSQMGIYRKNGKYRYSGAVNYVYAKVCNANRSLVNEYNAKYLLDTCLSSSFQILEFEEFSKYLLSNYEFNQEYIDLKFENIIRNREGYNLADILWGSVTDEVKYKIIERAKPYGLGISYSDESILFYFYKKGFITFDKIKDKNHKNKDLSYFITSLSIEMLKKIEFKITDELIEKFASINPRGNREYTIAYLFTIPEFREKVVDNPKWMFYKKDKYDNPFIDDWPREYQQKYIDKLMQELKEKREKNKNIN